MLDMQADQSWIEAWEAGTPTITPDALEWMRSRPPSIRALMVRFPPGCLVRGVGLGLPAPGKVAIVSSYWESEAPKRWELGLRPFPTSDFRAMANVLSLTVVGFYQGVSHDVVRRVLGGD